MVCVAHVACCYLSVRWFLNVCNDIVRSYVTMFCIDCIGIIPPICCTFEYTIISVKDNSKVTYFRNSKSNLIYPLIACILVDADLLN